MPSPLDHEPVFIDDSTVLDPTPNTGGEVLFNPILGTVLLQQSSISSYLECIGVIVGAGCLGCLVEFGADGTLSSAFDIKSVFSSPIPIECGGVFEVKQVAFIVLGFEGLASVVSLADEVNSTASAFACSPRFLVTFPAQSSEIKIAVDASPFGIDLVVCAPSSLIGQDSSPFTSP